MSEEIDLVAILSPAPGKADRVLEMMEAIGKIVLEKEPGTLKYELLKQTGDNPKIIVVEKYANGAALKVHGAFPEFKASFETMNSEGSLIGSPQIFIAKGVGGFASRI